jgi:ribonucleoside-diphosphate reductase beta chain
MLIKTPTESFVTKFPQADVFNDKQLSVFWLPTEIKVEKDVHDILTNFTEAEKHGVLTVLKLFSLYELFAGRDYWTGRIMDTFPRPEIQRMAATFGMFELAVHQPFYDKINKELGISTDEFYSSYIQDGDLKKRIDFLHSIVDSNNDAVSIATFSMLEGTVLYSNFAYLKHFQSQGKNKLLNIVRGINFSVRDENLHAEAGAWLFRELHPDGVIPHDTQKTIYENAHILREHEHIIIKKIFEKGKINGITDTQLRNFVDSRLNICLSNLGLKPVFKVDYNPIADWFYDGINNYVMNDFFTSVGNQYVRTWAESEFNW